MVGQVSETHPMPLGDSPVLGSSANVFGQVFAPACSSAVQIFIRQYTACQYQYNSLRCIIRKADHVTGHRMSNDAYQQGNFIPPSNFENSTWLAYIKECLIATEDYLRRKTEPSSTKTTQTPDFIEEAIQRHRLKLIDFFQGFLVSVDSRFSCFGCLMQIPQHSLGCGHFLCTDCVKMFGNMSAPGVVSLYTCPLDANPMSGFKPCSFKVGSETTPLKRGPTQFKSGYVSKPLRV